jgi:DNA-binding transcriptional ArsR family regulator
LTAFGDEIAGHALELLGSLWAELGVDGAARRHELQALDLEPLIVFTLCCADARLLAKALDWCANNSRYLSGPRLNHFLRRFGTPARQAFEMHGAPVLSSVLTPSAASQSVAAASRPRVSLTPDLRRPSLVQLRLRAVVGVSARAEVLKALLYTPEQALTASALASRAAYGKDAVAQALDLLTVAGITTAISEGKRMVYRLSRPVEFAQALAGVPPHFPDWAPLLLTLNVALRYARRSAAEPGMRLKAAGDAARSVRAELGRVPGAERPERVTDERSLTAFERWTQDFAAGLMGTPPAEPAQREVTYTVHRLALGGWLATIKDAAEQPRPLALSDSPELKPDRRARRRLKLDEVGAAAEMVESILLDIQTRELQRRQGSLVRRESITDSLLPALSRKFAVEQLEPMHKGQAAAFTEEFLQRWCASRRDYLSAAG